MKDGGAHAPRAVGTYRPVWVRRGKPVSRPRLVKSDLHAVAACVPDCPRCENSMVWRGRWQCDACPATISWTEYEGGRNAPRVSAPRALPPDAVASAPLFSSSEGHNCPSSDPAEEKAHRRRRWVQWLEGVELYTSLWRKRRAMRHVLKSGSAWHRDRAKGQAERFQRVMTCGAVRWVLQRRDEHGLKECRLESRCECWRVCQNCLSRRRFKLAQGIERQRELAFQVYARQRARWYRGSEGRWSEKLMTLTVPHGATPGDDARVLTRAWRELSKRIATHLKLDRGCEDRPVWVRALEVAPSESGGHAHLHFWWFGPFLDHAWLRAQFGDVLEGMGVRCPRKPWAEALASATDKRFATWARTRRGRNGAEPASVSWPVVDIRGGNVGAGKYAQKVGVTLYVAKGAKGVLDRIHPLHAATVYEALESARATQWARGWAPKVVKPEGVTFSRRRLTPDEQAEENARFEALDRDLLALLDRRDADLAKAVQSREGESSRVVIVRQLELAL